MSAPDKRVNNQEPYVECPMCRSKAWTIYMHKVQCCRCGLSYATPYITFLQMALIAETVPPPEVVRALEILDGPEK